MKQILEMIESVDPSDTAKLDEIDARVWCYLESHTFACIKWDRIFVLDEHQCEIEKFNGICTLKFTRSRDALKAIRPEGWQYCMEHSPAIGFQCTLQDKMGSPDNPPNIFKSPWYKAGSGGRTGLTEELAELHAILQAIAHERGE